MYVCHQNPVTILIQLLHSFVGHQSLVFPCTLQCAAIFERDVEAKTPHFVRVGGSHPNSDQNSWDGFSGKLPIGKLGQILFWGFDVQYYWEIGPNTFFGGVDVQ